MTSGPKETGYDPAELVAYYHTAGMLCALCVIVFGAAMLCGWLFGVPALIRLPAEWDAMHPSTALCMTTAGIALLAGGRAPPRGRSKQLRMAAASACCILAFMALIQYLFNTNLGIDAFFRGWSDFSRTGHVPGKMVSATPTMFFLSGAALVTLDSRFKMLTQPLALTSAGIASLTLLGDFYSLSSLSDIPSFSTVAFCTVFGNLILAVGILLIRPESGAVRMLVSDSLGGALARRLLPIAVAAPPLLGWLGLEGERRKIYDAPFGIALTALAYIVIFTYFTWRTSRELRHADQQRSEAERIAISQTLELCGLIESAMDAIVMLDENRCIVVFNPSAEAMFGHARADVLGRSLEILLPRRFRADHDRQISGFGSGAISSRRMGRLGSVTAIRADGSEFPVEASISTSCTCAGRRYTAIVRDVTDRVRVDLALHESALRESARAQELAKLLFAVPAAVCFSYNDRRIALAGNRVHANWFGDSLNIEPPLGTRPSGQFALQQAAQGEQIKNYEFQHEYPDGVIRYLMGNAMPLCDEDGTPCGAVSVFVDVTDLKLAELAMISLMAGSEAKSNYITHMTHELRTPLSAILSYSQLLERTVSTPSHLAACQHISKAGWHLRDLIAEVQDFATIEAQSAGLQAESIPVDEMLLDLCGMLTPLFSDAELSVDLIGTPELTIHANPVRLKQILLNLLSNAIKYNRRGGNIAISRCIDGRSQVTISIRDCGHGMTDTDLANLFQPFNRLGQERGIQEGTGVGLVVTKKLLESMGGSIGVESEIGRGSLFWFTLPSTLRNAPIAACCEG